MDFPPQGGHLSAARVFLVSGEPQFLAMRLDFHNSILNLVQIVGKTMKLSTYPALAVSERWEELQASRPR